MLVPNLVYSGMLILNRRSTYPKFLNINVFVIPLLCVTTLKVHENWKRSLQEIPNYESLEVDCKQVKRCIEIAINCMEKERRKRPTIKDIVKKLDETGTVEIDSHFQMKKVVSFTFFYM